MKRFVLLYLLIMSLESVPASDLSPDRQFFPTLEKLENLGLRVTLEGHDSKGLIHLKAKVPENFNVKLPDGIALNKKPVGPVNSRWFYVNMDTNSTGAPPPELGGSQTTLRPQSPGTPGAFLLESETPILDTRLDQIRAEDVSKGFEPMLLRDTQNLKVPEQKSLESCDTDWPLAHTYYCPNNPTGPRNGPIVAILDTGIDFTHPQLTSEELLSHSVIDEHHNGDTGTHGTAVAGIVGAAPIADSPVVGVCPQARLMSVRIADSGGILHASNLFAGIRWAIENGAEIINISYTTHVEENIDVDALAMVLDYAKNEDVLIVVSSGTDTGPEVQNSDFPFKYANSYDNLIVVMGFESQYQPLRYSRKFGKNQIHIAAPGNLITTTLSAQNGVREKLCATRTGTSFAAPFVTGALAALRQHYGNTKTSAELREMLFSTFACKSASLEDYCIEGRSLNLKALCDTLGTPSPFAAGG